MELGLDFGKKKTDLSSVLINGEAGGLGLFGS